MGIRRRAWTMNFGAKGLKCGAGSLELLKKGANDTIPKLLIKNLIITTR